MRALRAVGRDVVAVVAAGAEDAASSRRRCARQDFPHRGPWFRAACLRGRQADTRRDPVSDARADLPTMVSDFVAEHGEKLATPFVVVQPGRTRFGLAQRDWSHGSPCCAASARCLRPGD